jgi:competence ComEA-like helix-hairpin-helix protein
VEELAHKRLALMVVAYTALAVAVARHEAGEFAAGRLPVSRKSAMPKPTTAPSVVPVNTSDAETLASLPGVGPSLAAHIVAYRDEHGSFRSLAELDNVPGIGPKLLQRILARVSLAAPSQQRDSGVEEPGEP